MDAANPLCRWLLAAGLLAAAGCRTDGAAALPKARGQLPPDPAGPLAPPGPVAPINPARLPLQGSPVPPNPPAAPGTPRGPVPGSPVVTDPNLQTAGYSALPGAAKAAEAARDAVPQIKVVALVGSTGLVTDQEIVEAVRQRPDLAGLDGHALRAKEKELYAVMLRKVIERELVLDEMYTKLKKANKMAVIEDIKEYAGKAADQSLRAIRKEIGLDTEEKFQFWLRVQGLTEPVIRRQIERQMMADEYVRGMLKEKGHPPGLGEIRAYYDRHPDEFKTDDRVRWQDVFIPLGRFASPQAARRHAEAVRKQAAAGADFVELAKAQESPEVAARRKNWDGIGTTRKDIPPDVADTVLSLRPGELSDLVETPAGYHVVKVVEREYAGVRPFDAKVQADIRRKLVEHRRVAEYDRLVEDLWRKGAVRVIE